MSATSSFKPLRVLASRGWQGPLLVLPSALLVFGIALVPIGVAIWQSTEERVLVFHVARFVGLGNYRFLLEDPRFWTALGNTAYFAVVSVIVEAALGLSFALLLDASVPRRAPEASAKPAWLGPALLRAAILVPWAIPSAISAKIWAWLYNPEYGLLPAIMPGPKVSFLGTPGYAMHAAILVDVWKTTPFVTLLFLSALRGIPEELYRAAKLDGASALRRFWSITLPLLKPAAALVLVLRTLDGFRVFDSIFVLTAGGPANTTETLSIYTYQTLMDAGQIGYGATLAVVTFVIILAISVVYLALLGREIGA